MLFVILLAIAAGLWFFLKFLPDYAETRDILEDAPDSIVLNQEAALRYVKQRKKERRKNIGKASAKEVVYRKADYSDEGFFQLPRFRFPGSR